MGTVYDENNPVDSGDEVKKLQDLVKKLEKQNQILKSKQNDNETDTRVKTGLKDNGTIPKYSRIDNTKSNSRYKNQLDDVDILDLDDKPEDDEDSWLFTSPKTSAVKKISPYKWVRQDLEKGSPEVENTRKSLVFRLDDATKMVRSPSSGAVGSLAQSNSPRLAVPQSSRNNNFEESPRQRKSLSSLENRAYDGHVNDEEADGSRINTNTFRLKKRTYNATPTNQIGTDRTRDGLISSPRSVESPRQSPEQHRPDATERLRDVGIADSAAHDRNGNGGMSRQSSTDTNSIDSPRDGEYNKLTDVVDVQVLARMQEDSLRKSMTSPAQFANRKALSKPSAMSSSNGYGSNRSSPARYQEHDGSTHQRTMGQSNQSLGSLSSHSDSPAASPYGSHQHLEHDQQAHDAHRRSMPNLAKTMPMSLSSHPSDPELNENPINTNTFTRRKGGAEKKPLSRYGSGGLAARSPAQGLATYQRTQSPAARANTPQRHLSPQRSYQVRNVSPVRTGQARNVSPVRTGQARNVSPVNAPQARNVSPVRRQVRNVSPVNAYQARNVSPVRNSTLHDSHSSPVLAPQARNASPGRSHLATARGGYASEPRSSSDWSANSGTYTRTKSPQTAGRPNYSANSLRTPPNPSRTLSPQRASSAGSDKSMSPMRSSLPAPKSTGIPRPGSSSRLPAPRKSAIPASRRAALFNRSADDSSWKDGCY